MNMIIALRWCDSEIIIGTHSEGTGNDLPHEVRCLTSYFQLPFLILVRDVGSFREDELWGDANLDKVLHDFAQYANPVHSLQVDFQVSSTKFPLLALALNDAINSSSVGSFNSPSAVSPTYGIYPSYSGRSLTLFTWS